MTHRKSNKKPSTPSESESGKQPSVQKAEDEKGSAAQNRYMEEQKKVNEEDRATEEKYRTKLEQEVRDQTAELKTSNDLLQATMNASMDMIQVFEAVRNDQNEIIDFRYILLNHEAEKWIPGLPGQSLLQLQPGVVEEGIFDAFKKVVETGVPQQYEKHYVHEQFNGWYYQSVVKLNDGVATTTSNITKRKVAEEQLKSTKERLQITLDSSLYHIQVFKAVRDAQGKIIDFEWILTNRKWNEQYGDVIGKSLLQLNPGVVETGLFDKFVQVTETGIVIDHEQYYSHEQFDDQWFHQTLVKMDDGFVMNAVDITERKRAEAEILRLKDEVAQRATDKYYSIFNSIEEGFCIYELLYDNNGKPVDLQWVEVNPGYAKQTGLEDVVGKKHSEMGLETEHYWLDVYDKVATTGESTYFENWHEPTQRWYHVFASRVSDAANNQVAVVFEDITERKRREQQQTFLLSFSDTLRAERTADGVANRALEMLIEYLRLDRSYIVSYYLEKNIALLDYQIGNETVPPLPDTFDLSHYPEAFKAVVDQTLVIEDDFERQGLSEAEKQNASKLGMRAMIAATVRKGENKPLWSMVAINSKPRRWTPDEVQLMEEVAERTWAAVEKAKAEEALRASEERKEFLLKLNDALRDLSDPAAIEYEAARLVAEQLNADRVHFAELSDEEKLVIRRDYVRGNAPSIAGVTKAKAIAAALKLERDEPVVIPDVTSFPLLTEEEKATLAAAKIRSQLSVALSKKGKKVASFSVDQATPREWKPAEIAILQEAAERTLAAVERAKAEEAVKQNEARFRTLADAVPQIIWTNSAAGKADYFNQRWLEFSGLSYEQSEGLGWQAIVHPADKAESVKKWQHALATGAVFDTEYRLRRHDGNYRWFIGRNVPLKDEAGNVTGWFGSATDIHELKDIQEALSQSEARLRITMESATDYGIITMDKERKVEQWSQGATQLLQYTEEEMKGQSADIIFTPEDREKAVPQQEMETARDTGRAADERWHQRKDGSRFFASGVLRPIRNKELTGYVKVMRDATQQQLFTKELHRLVAERTHELQRSNEDLQQFAVIASHDLQEPLRKLRLFASVLQRYREQLPEEGKSVLSKIALTSDRMSQLIREVLRYSRLMSGDREFVPTDLDAVLRMFYATWTCR